MSEGRANTNRPTGADADDVSCAICERPEGSYATYEECSCWCHPAPTDADARKNAWKRFIGGVTTSTNGGPSEAFTPNESNYPVVISAFYAGWAASSEFSASTQDDLEEP